MAVGDGAHHVAGGQVVEVVVHAQHDGQDEGGPQGAGLGLDVGNSPVAVGLGAAGPDHQGHQGSQQNQEHQDGGVAAHVGAQTVNEVLQGGQNVAVDVQQASDEDAQEQGRIHFLGDQCQDDCHHGRQDGKDGVVRDAVRGLTLGKSHGDHDACQGEYDEQEPSKALHSW